MSMLTPDQARLILDTTGLPLVKAEHPVTKSVIAAIPADKAVGAVPVEQANQAPAWIEVSG